MVKKKPAPKGKFRPAAGKTADVAKSCLCGCGGQPKGRFLPGHDAKLKGQLKREATGDDPEVAAAAVKRLASLGWSWVIETSPEQKAARKASLEAAKVAKEERKVERAEEQVARGSKARFFKLADGRPVEAGVRKTPEQINSEYKADFQALMAEHGKYNVPRTEVDRLQRRLLEDFTRRVA